MDALLNLCTLIGGISGLLYLLEKAPLQRPSPDSSTLFRASFCGFLGVVTACIAVYGGSILALQWGIFGFFSVLVLCYRASLTVLQREIISTGACFVLLYSCSIGAIVGLILAPIPSSIPVGSLRFTAAFAFISSVAGFVLGWFFVTPELRITSPSKQAFANKGENKAFIFVPHSPSDKPVVLSLKPQMIITLGRESIRKIVGRFDQGISRQHAEISTTGTRTKITDRKSRNGTFVNNVRLRPGEGKALAHGDRIRMGSIEFEYLESNRGSLRARLLAGLVEAR
jgi:FHA domain